MVCQYYVADLVFGIIINKCNLSLKWIELSHSNCHTPKNFQ